MTDDPMRDFLEEATTTIATGGDVRRAVGLVSLLSVVTTSVAAVTAAIVALVVFLFRPVAIRLPARLRATARMNEVATRCASGSGSATALGRTENRSEI